jgi:hypothetical protein
MNEISMVSDIEYKKVIDDNIELRKENDILKNKLKDMEEFYKIRESIYEINLKDDVVGKLKDDVVGKLKDDVVGKLKDDVIGKLKDDVVGKLKDDLIYKKIVVNITDLKEELEKTLIKLNHTLCAPYNAKHETIDELEKKMIKLQNMIENMEEELEDEALEDEELEDDDVSVDDVKKIKKVDNVDLKEEIEQLQGDYADLKDEVDDLISGAEESVNEIEKLRIDVDELKKIISQLPKFTNAPK